MIDHPEYVQEKRHLDDTILYLYKELESLKEPITVQAADDRAARSARKTMVSRSNVLKEARRQPYFGRVDWQPIGCQSPEEFYIGKLALPDAGIYSWADNMVAELYYTQATWREHGDLMLKRTFEIAGDTLHAIRDEYVHPSQEHRAGRIIDKFTDALFVALLQSHRTGQLHDIVATLQAQQYAIIRSPRDQLLVVQGVTGSGKTEIALHRIAYLLYHHRAAREVEPKNVLVLGPNRIFISYISNVLPQLGERQIPQNTFDSWMIERLGAPVEYEAQDASLELLVDPQTPATIRAMRYRNARNKGSLRMAALIDRYVDILHTELLDGDQPLVCTVTLGGSSATGEATRVRFTGTRTTEALRSMLDSLRDYPLNLRRDELKDRVLLAMAQALQKQARERFPRDDFGDAIAKQLRPQIDSYFSGWKSLNVSVGYRRLLRTPHLLQQAGEGVFSQSDLELLAQDAPTALRPFRFSDLGALLYLKLRLDGSDGIRYDHIVIDEAQDITPLHFKVLYEFSRDNSMTILGDLAQGIYPYHGVADWEELVPLVGREAIRMETLHQSYRSTSEIISFANDLLRRTGVAETELAQPVARSGPSPVLRQYSDTTALVDAIVDAVETEHSLGHTSIAIICKTVRDCLALADRLEERLELQRLVDRDQSYTGATVVIPSYLTKGLEFDAVIIADAQAEIYRPNNLDARLLYVSLTRASHSLYVFWAGSISPLIDVDIPHVELQTVIDGGLAPEPVTVEEYIQPAGSLNADSCIERLAGADKLRLLANGRIDPVVLDLLMRSSTRRTDNEEEEGSNTPLAAERESALRRQVERWESAQPSDHDPDADQPHAALPDALALAQLCFGLLRNQLRAAGLETTETVGTLVGEQVVQLVTLLKAVDHGLALSLGRWTTQQRALLGVKEEYRVLASEQLALLMNYGIVEQGGQDQRLQIRVLPERLEGILRLSLGYVPEDWDQDLLAQLPRLPHTLDWRESKEL